MYRKNWSQSCAPILKFSKSIKEYKRDILKSNEITEQFRFHNIYIVIPINPLCKIKHRRIRQSSSCTSRVVKALGIDGARVT